MRGDPAVAKISEMLKVNSTLTELDLASKTRRRDEDGFQFNSVSLNLGFFYAQLDGLLLKEQTC